MTLFTVGPVEMFPGTLEVSGSQLPYFRTDEFSALMKENEALMKRFVRASDDDKVIMLTTSGTGAMEASVINCFDGKDRLLIINGGSFGNRFCQICDIHGIPYEQIALGFGERLTEDIMGRYDGKGFTGLLVNMDETSTGQLYDMGMLSSFCRRNGMYLVVDAISSFLADEIDFSAWGIDALIVSSQKALALSPGLSVVVLSSRMIGERVSVIPQRTMYMDFRTHMKDMERGQTPFTPAVGVILELHQRLKAIESEGLEAEISKVRSRAEHFRNGLKGLPVSLPDFPLSNAVTPLIIENGDAYGLFRTLKERYGMVVTPSGGALRDRIVRVSHIGNLRDVDYDSLIGCMREVLL